MTWYIQKLCTNIGEYELVIEAQKKSWRCEHEHSRWRWSVIFHGTIVTSGYAADQEVAKKRARESLPPGK